MDTYSTDLMFKLACKLGFLELCLVKFSPKMLCIPKFSCKSLNKYYIPIMLTIIS